MNKAAGFLAGKLSAIGFDAQMNAAVETLTHDILASSEIEGVVLNSDQVRSSVARRMGVHIVGDVEPSHYIEGVVEMMMVTVESAAPLQIWLLVRRMIPRSVSSVYPVRSIGTSASITTFWSVARKVTATLLHG